MSDEDVVAGIDEAGRGALAGPVVAAACVLIEPLVKMRSSIPRWRPRDRAHAHCIVTDSKLLDPQAREIAYAWIVERCVWGVGACSAAEIDALGILGATNRAMSLAVDMLAKHRVPTSLLVDGRDKFRFAFPHRSIVRGDSIEPCIAAASVIAKVTRDRLLVDLEKSHPLFSFAKHKGYGTDVHLRELKTNGPTPEHRAKFIRNALGLHEEAPSLFTLSDASEG